MRTSIILSALLVLTACGGGGQQSAPPVDERRQINEFSALVNDPAAAFRLGCETDWVVYTIGSVASPSDRDDVQITCATQEQIDKNSAWAI